jgi:hypothetical protein
LREDLASLVPALLQASPLVATVELCGSRASGTAGLHSDWDFRVATEDFAALASELPELIRALEPLVEQWDRLSDEACYMLVVSGPTKIDLIFPDVPHEHEPPWVVDAGTLSALDDHFWDWVLWLTSKVDAGNDSLVEAELAAMRDHILVPMGITAPITSAAPSGRAVPRRAQQLHSAFRRGVRPSCGVRGCTDRRGSQPTLSERYAGAAQPSGVQGRLLRPCDAKPQHVW